MPFADPTCGICPFTVTTRRGNRQDPDESPQSTRTPPAVLCNISPAASGPSKAALPFDLLVWTQEHTSHVKSVACKSLRACCVACSEKCVTFGDQGHKVAGGSLLSVVAMGTQHRDSAGRGPLAAGATPRRVSRSRSPPRRGFWSRQLCKAGGLSRKCWGCSRFWEL